MAKTLLFVGALGASVAILLGTSANGATPDIQVGAAAQVVNSVYGTPESTGQARWWRSGLDVFHNETVVTAEVSASRVIFRDKSQLSIGPTSWVKLDTFVYDPNPATAAVSISFVKGVFRFVSGSSSKENYKITTPAASIGVRGTAFTVSILQGGREIISVESGTVYVTCHRGVTVALNAGQMTYINSPQGSPNPAQPSAPIPAVAQMDAILPR
jgi:hypothetical protein